MVKKIILHVGSPKCGSTYFQRAMLQNQSRLADAGIIYPKPPNKHPGNGLLAYDGISSKLSSIIDRYETVILSHEDLFSQAPRMKHLTSWCDELKCDLQVVVFLRPFSEFIFGDYSQFLKQNFEKYQSCGVAYEGRSFEKFAVFRRSQIAPAAWLALWAGISNRPLIVSSHKMIPQVFEEITGTANLDWSVERMQSNPSLRVADCEEISRMISLGLPKAKISDAFKIAFLKTGITDGGRSSDRVKWIEALFEIQNRKILDRFGYDNRNLEHLE